MSLIFKWNVYFEGEGAGVLQIVAESGSLLSETYILDDCYFIETGSTTSGMYSSSGGTLTLEDGVFTLTRGSGTSYFYLNIPKTNLPIADFKGKHLIVKADVITLTGSSFRMSITPYENSAWGTASTVDVTTTGTIENSIDVSSNATQVRIRFDIYGNEGDSVTLENFRLL